MTYTTINSVKRSIFIYVKLLSQKFQNYQDEYRVAHIVKSVLKEYISFFTILTLSLLKGYNFIYACLGWKVLEEKEKDENSILNKYSLIYDFFFSKKEYNTK